MGERGILRGNVARRQRRVKAKEIRELKVGRLGKEVSEKAILVSRRRVSLRKAVLGREKKKEKGKEKENILGRAGLDL